MEDTPLLENLLSLKYEIIVLIYKKYLKIFIIINN